MIARQPAAAAAERYDLAVIGGGIHGANVALEAVRRGARVLLLDGADFGAGASSNSLRILHGGLRYLQTLDLVRFRESVAERRWFARTFPALVAPLSCFMPLYAQGMKRRSVMRVALAMNDRFSWDRNDGVEARVALPGSGTLDAAQARSRFPGTRPQGLEGAALWYDYRMRSSERVLMEILHWGCRLGLRALNYLEAESVLVQGGKAIGVTAVDRLDGRRYSFPAERICNCTGSSARAFAAANDREHARLFVPSLAFNVLFDCATPSQDALAVAAPEPGAPVYFLCPSPFGLWAGTEHVGRPDECRSATVTEAELSDFMQRINRAIPGIDLQRRQVRRIFSGLLPVRVAGSVSLTSREAIVDHGAAGGPQGLYSVTGIKFTTARKVGVRAVEQMLGAHNRDAVESAQARDVPPLAAATDLLLDGARVAALDPVKAVNMIREVAAAEAVHCAEDFCLRRTNWIFSAADYASLENLVAQALAAPANLRAVSGAGS
jgi:glycerol-3-phosphate dehydrogenase